MAEVRQAQNVPNAHQYLSIPNTVQPKLNPHSIGPPLWSSTVARPLSDIRELSEPSLVGHVVRNSFNRLPRQPRTQPIPSTKSNEPARGHVNDFVTRPNPPPRLEIVRAQENGGSSSYSSTPERSSSYSIPTASVPRRSSSNHHARLQPRSHSRKASLDGDEPVRLDQPSHGVFLVPNRGQSQSPVKETGLRLDAHTSELARRTPSQTYVRHPHPVDILEFHTCRHPRVRLEIHVSAPLFVGGGTVEGCVKVTVDDNEKLRHRRSISIGAMAVDLLGFEEVSNDRKATFLALGTELLDANHPPPPDMIQPANPLFADDKFWPLVPSCTSLQFMITLPLITGPPPFQSKNANIRFLLCATALIRDVGRHYRVRASQDIHVLSTYDPEAALTSLPSPLTVSEEVPMARMNGLESLKVTAGLHRQVWLSGGSIFADVHIANKSRKLVRKLELTLERAILCYKHAAAATREKSASPKRIPESNEWTTLARTVLKPGSPGWNGVEAHSSDTRTCELEIPRGHATVRDGKYLEVHFFLNIVASVSGSKPVTLQLPIYLIHMNSLDVVPNSVAQVAAAIEEKRKQAGRKLSRARKSTRVARNVERSSSLPADASCPQRRPSNTQGRAFAAPREQSLDRQREHRADMDGIRAILDSSPRKNKKSAKEHRRGFVIRKLSRSSLSSNSSPPSAKKATKTLSVFGMMSYRTPPRDSGPALLAVPPPPLQPDRQASNVLRPKTALGSRRDDTAGPRYGMRRLQSHEPLYGGRSALEVFATSATRAASQPPQIPPPPFPRQNSATSLHRRFLTPQTLGLTAATNRKVSLDGFERDNVSDAALAGLGKNGRERPGTTMSTRERTDRARLDLRAVARKVSGASLKAKGTTWWDGMIRSHRERERQRNLEREREGWI